MAGNPGRHGLRNFVFAAVAALIASAAAAQAADPYQWLEEINGAKPLAQVKAWNAETEADLTKVPGYEEHRQPWLGRNSSGRIPPSCSRG